MTKYYTLLCEISKKHGRVIILEEEELLLNKATLDIYIDDLLVEELVSCGLGADDEPNSYGSAIEDAIDYFNRFRI